MNWEIWATLLVPILFVGVFILASRLIIKSRKSQLKCPQCGSTKIGQLSDEVIEVKDRGRSAPSETGSFSVQLTRKKTYQCNQCFSKWTSSHPESR